MSSTDDEPSLFQRLRAAARTARRFVTHDLWSLEAGGLPTFRALLLWISRVTYIAVRGFQRDRCMFHAAALTYISVLSIVPVLAFSFSVAKGLGAFESLVGGVIEPALDEVFPVPVGEATAGDEGPATVRGAIETLLAFVDETDVSKLGIFGLAALVWGVLKMLGSIERSFNEIWGVRSSRSIVRKVSDYLAIVIVVPIFLLTATTLFASDGSAWFVEMVERLHLGPLLEFVMRFVPLVVVWFVFAFVYLCLPNKRLRIASAVVGGVGGGTLWLLLQIAHVKLQLWTANFNAIYAGFAAFPLFLVWIYASWVVVLFGAELASAHHKAPTYRGSAYVGPLPHALREVVALRALTRIAERFLRGGAAWTPAALSESMRVPEVWIDDVADALLDARILVVVEETGALAPARALELIRIVDVQVALAGESGVDRFPARTPADERVETALRRLRDEARDSALNPSLRTLAEEAVRDAEASVDPDARASADPLPGAG